MIMLIMFIIMLVMLISVMLIMLIVMPIVRFNACDIVLITVVYQTKFYKLGMAVWLPRRAT